MENIILQMKDITKEFPGVKALDSVNIKVRKNSIHALCGENGAGKSTLMNVLSGIYPYGSYSGDILYQNEVCKFKNIKDSEKEGIVIIHQELALVPYLSIMENIFLGNENSKHQVIDWDKTRHEAEKLLKTVGLNEKPDTLIKDIGVGKQQLVEIAKALTKDVKLLILDEPTAALNDNDSEKLLDLILKLRDEQGITAIIISHKLNEITKVADDITVIRDGKCIETLNKETDDINEDRIIKGMVGREIGNRFPDRTNEIGDIAFEVSDWTVQDENNHEKLACDHVSFNVRHGEVVGIAGLMGSGRTELAMSIFGRSYGKHLGGTVKLNGKEINLKNVSDAIKNKIAYVTEDRKDKGLILFESIRINTTLPSLDKLSNTGIVNVNEEVKVSNEYLKKVNIKAQTIHQPVSSLSGGNQQKVMLARWVYADPEVIIFDEPTRGIDVGAKYEIYCIINELAARGKSVIVISSEMPEVIGLSDRVYVMNEGKFIAELEKDQITQEEIMRNIIQNS